MMKTLVGMCLAIGLWMVSLPLSHAQIGELCRLCTSGQLQKGGFSLVVGQSIAEVDGELAKGDALLSQGMEQLKKAKRKAGRHKWLIGSKPKREIKKAITKMMDNRRWISTVRGELQQFLRRAHTIGESDCDGAFQYIVDLHTKIEAIAQSAKNRQQELEGIIGRLKKLGQSPSPQKGKDSYWASFLREGLVSSAFAKPPKIGIPEFKKPPQVFEPAPELRKEVFTEEIYEMFLLVNELILNQMAQDLAKPNYVLPRFERKLKAERLGEQSWYQTDQGKSVQCGT